jgi:hypothetical protein
MLSCRGLGRCSGLIQRRGRSLQQPKRGMAVEGSVPVPQSSTAVMFAGHPAREGWESTIGWWYTSSFVLICIVINTTPDTSIQAWASQEARARLALKDKGFTDFKFGTHYQSLSKSELKSAWDSLSSKNTRMNDDDDDDEEDEEEEEKEDDDEDDDE